ncbi:MAG: hypothetical protein QGM50_00660 [Anaerolineae bacterium]|nr:hypothetical protein [Anaerolineae bacterium]MDK1117276.1 hypothetical protein [Anaerolineae bacterium]
MWRIPFIPEFIELNRLTRKEAPGELVKLSNGYTHYQLCGPEDGYPDILFQGVSGPYFMWDRTFNFLTKSGYRVLRYD